MAQKVNIYYAVLQYTPSVIRRENINIGIAFHIPAYQISRFVSTRNTRRVASFDDEWDKEFFDITMEALHEDLDFPTTGRAKNQTMNAFFPEDELFDKDSLDYLKEKTEYFANEFQFLDVECLVSENGNVESDIEDLERTFLYYDRPKSKRITTPAAKRLLKKSLKSKLSAENFSEPKIKGKFDNKPLMDVKLGEEYYKVTSFDYEKSSVRAKELKSTLFDVLTATREENIKNIKVVVCEDMSNISKCGSADDRETFEDFQNEVNQININYNSKVEIVSLQDIMLMDAM